MSNWNPVPGKFPVFVEIVHPSSREIVKQTKADDSSVIEHLTYAANLQIRVIYNKGEVWILDSIRDGVVSGHWEDSCSVPEP